MHVTQRQLAESITGLARIAQDLREAADADPLEDTRGLLVPASVKGLRMHADFLERVTQELLKLIDDEIPVKLPKD